MNHVATMLTNLLSNRRSLETLQSYKKYCDPVIDEWDDEILTSEDSPQAVDLPSLYEKYCTDSLEQTISEDLNSTASSYDEEQHQSDNLRVCQASHQSENDDEYCENFEEEGEYGSSHCSSSGGDVSAVQCDDQGDSRCSQHQHTACSDDETYPYSETSHLAEVAGVEDSYYDEDWVEDGQEELHKADASDCASPSLSIASSCSISNGSLRSHIREERTQNIQYPLPSRQLMRFAAPPGHIAASIKCKRAVKTQNLAPYLTRRSPYLDFSSSTEFILLSRRPCYRSTQTSHRETGACAAVRCARNQMDSPHTAGRTSSSVYVRASLVSAAARTSSHCPNRQEVESDALSQSTVDDIYNSGRFGYLKRSASELTHKKRAHHMHSGREVEDSLRRQVIYSQIKQLFFFFKS